MKTKRRRTGNKSVLSGLGSGLNIVQFEVRPPHPLAGTRYGTAVNLGVFREVERKVLREAKRGRLVIIDGELPVQWIRKPDKLAINYVGAEQAYERWLRERHRLAVELERQATKSNRLIGRMFTSVGRMSEGFCYYAITAASRTTVDIEWRGYAHLELMDFYVDPLLGWKCTLPRKLITPKLFTTR